jgi:hypothetical protein
MKRSLRFRIERLEPRAMLSVSGDFNGDGFDDLAISVDGETSFQGAVSVIYGTSTKLKTTGNQLWTLDSPGINGVAHNADHFGSVLTAGDFDGDGFDDLAIGTPAYKVDKHAAAGAVNIIYGSSSGLRATGDQQFTQNSTNIADSAQDFDLFGAALESGDFNNDGRDDLAIGSTGENQGATNDAGSVHVLYGGSNGLKSSDSQFWTQDSAGINDSAAAMEFFGSALAAGDFNNDGRDDLAIGVRGETVGGFQGAGAVNVIYGTSSGLSGTGDQYWDANSSGIISAPSATANFGGAITTGDFDGDNFADLAIGSPNAIVNGTSGVGAIDVMYGSSTKLNTFNSQYFSPLNLGITVANNEHFGTTLVAGDFRKVGRDDLTVGIFSYSIGGASNCGAVQIIQSVAGSGLSASSSYLRSQDTSEVADMAETGDNFGRGLATGDYNGDGFFDLAIGAPGEDLLVGSNVMNAGVVHVLYGIASGLVGSGSQIFSQDTIGMLGSPTQSDNFGLALV